MIKPGLDRYRRVFFLGIGGIGMSALARYFKAAGLNVAGYDRTSTPLTDELHAEGIDIHFEDNLERVPDDFRSPFSKGDTLIILTPAVTQDHDELNYFLTRNYTVMKRSQVLGLITEGFDTLAVAGTHGKTTTSSILAHILRTAGFNTTAFLGGISVNYHSNLLLGDPSKEHHNIVVEADEFDRSFLTLFPSKAIITSMDADHLDIYGSHTAMQDSYNQFASQVRKNGLLMVHAGLQLGRGVEAKCMTYSCSGDADVRGTDIRIADGRYIFNLETPSTVIKDLTLGLPGRHNVENAVAAAALALEHGAKPEAVTEALSSYRGVHRRFETHIQNKDLVYIDDYAHHPAELKAAINSAREMYPGKKITGIFQPHLFSRTRDFVDGFAESLDLLDKLFLLEIYPAREKPIEGVTSKMIADKMHLADKQIVSNEELIAELRRTKPEVLLTLGAGDIDKLIEPIKKLLTESWS